MIYSFTAGSGRRAGHTYYFPTTNADVRTSQRTNTLQDIANTDGQYDASGTAAMPVLAGIATITFDFYTAWYVSNKNAVNYYHGSASDIVARENALLDFMVSFVEGGLGTLIDEYAALGNVGIVDPVSGAAINNYQYQAKVSGNVVITRQQSHSTVAVDLSVASGFVRLSTGQLVQFL